MASNTPTEPINDSNAPRKRQKVSRSYPEQLNTSCHRCREKKIKCDGRDSTCGACSKVGSSCIIVDSITGKEYTRTHVKSLQDRIRRLQELLASHGVDKEDIASHIPKAPVQVHSRSEHQEPRHIPRFIGEESGTGYIQYILQAIRRGWQDPIFGNSIQESAIGPSVIDHPPYLLPPAREGAELIATYLRGFHSQHTFLQRSEVLNMHDRVHQAMSTGQNLNYSRRRDLFQLNLIYALASVDSHRKGFSDKHPFGYFTAGLQHLNGNLNFESVQDIQGFLLIARFGLYYYIGCSIWEICQICLRICIELRLHTTSREESSTLLVEQMKRRVFWECYQLDKFSSTTLGRPFGIEDSDIEIDLPFDAEDDELESLDMSQISRMSPTAGLSSSNGEVSVFNCCVRLGRITCRIHRALHFRIPGEESQKNSVARWVSADLHVCASPGDTYHLFRGFYMELKSWRCSCPVFTSPRCPSQSREWFDFLYEREKLALIRAAIDQVHSRYTFPSRELLNPCHNTAVVVIRLYDQLRRKGHITYSWSYLQLMLSCGLSVIFCIFVKLDNRNAHGEMGAQDLDHFWMDLEPMAFRDFRFEDSTVAIDKCAEILHWMAGQIKEMARYAHFFNMMRRGILNKLHQRPNRKSHNDYRVEPQTFGTQELSAQEIFGGNDGDVHHNHHQSHLSDQRPSMDPCTQAADDTGGFQYSRAQQPDYSPNVHSSVFADNLDMDFERSPNKGSTTATGFDDTFEPLVRQLFGEGMAMDGGALSYVDNSADISSWALQQDPLLAAFTSGLEGFMWEATDLSWNE
ncbi:hypothetical protein V499_00009 [Pseudogymnoascus sp. VKM F-103]|nr:hypothetical protein V499_00009 [Pseudogymnoascus sp. VKM F-103]